jgi:hypothetical protein
VKLIAIGLPFMLGGLGLLFAMVIRLIEPGLWLSLGAFAAMFGGTMLAIVGTVEAVRGRVPGHRSRN